MKAGRAKTILGVLLAATCLASAADPHIAVGAVVPEDIGIYGQVSPAVVAEEVEVCLIEARASERCVHPDSGGGYDFAPLPPGQYRVGFFPSYQSHYLTEYYNGAARLNEASAVTVGKIKATTGINASLELGAEIQGSVTDALSSAALADVEACALDATSFLPVGCARSDAAGKYAIPSVPSGTYRIGFWGEKSSAAYAPQFYDGEATLFDATPLTVSAGTTVAGIDAGLHLGARFEGTVSDAASGARLPEIAVCAFEAGAARPERCAITDAAGRYAMPGVASGSYEVVFSPEFNEFATGEFVLPEEDGYRTQYYSAAPTRAGAKALSLSAPAVTGDVDASLLSTREASLPSLPPQLQPFVVPTAFSPVAATKTRKSAKCKRGFTKRKVKGKIRCVKKHRVKKHDRRRR